MNRKAKTALSPSQQHQSPLLLTSHSVHLMYATLTLDLAACFLQMLKQSPSNSSLAFFPLLYFFHFINCLGLFFPPIYVISAVVFMHLKPPPVQ